MLQCSNAWDADRCEELPFGWQYINSPNIRFDPQQPICLLPWTGRTTPGFVLAISRFFGALKGPLFGLDRNAHT